MNGDIWRNVCYRYVMRDARQPYLAYLDSLRGIAALGVAAFWHYQQFSSISQSGYPPFSASPLFGVPPFHSLYNYGYLFVDLFFMISGVVFGHVYGAAIAERRIGFARFAWLRFARLYPLHLLTLLLAGGLAWLFHAYTGRFPTHEYNDARHFIANLLFLQVVPGLCRGLSFNAPAWSLSTEAMMYGLFFIVAAAGRARTVAPLLVGLGLAGWLCGGDLAFMRGLVGFFGGLLIQHMSARSLLHRAIVPLLFCVFLLLVQTGAMPRAAGVEPSFAYAWAAAAVLLTVLQASPLLQRLLEVRPLRALGDLSLGIYLLQVPVQFLVLLVLVRLQIVAPTGSLAFWAGVAALEVAAAWAVHVSFERPARNWLRALPSRRKPSWSERPA